MFAKTQLLDLSMQGAAYHVFTETFKDAEEVKGELEYCKAFISPNSGPIGSYYSLLNYLSFNEWVTFLTTKNDMKDADTVAKGLSPYFPKEIISPNPEKETMGVESPKPGDQFYNLIDTLLSEKRNSLFVKPSSEKLKVDPLLSMLKKFETYFLLETDKLDLLLDLAQLKFSCFDDYRQYMNMLNFRKGEESLNYYKSIIKGLTLRKMFLLSRWQCNIDCKLNYTDYFCLSRMVKKNIEDRIVLCSS